MNNQVTMKAGHNFRYAGSNLKAENAHRPVVLQPVPGLVLDQAPVRMRSNSDVPRIEPPSENTIHIWIVMICLFGGWWPLIALYLAHRERKLAIMYFATNDTALGNLSSKKSHLRMMWTYVSFIIGVILIQMAYIVFMVFMMKQSTEVR